jgi:hypothetical protein
MPRVYITITRENPAYLSDRLRELTDSAGELYAKYVRSRHAIVLMTRITTERPLRSFAPLVELIAPAGVYVLARYKHEKFELRCVSHMSENKTSSIEWISSAPARSEYITVDRQQRIYLSSAACALLRVDPAGGFALIFGYDAVNKRIIAAKPDVVRVPDVRPFGFTKQRYAHAKSFVRQANIDRADLPIRFEFVGKDYGDAPAGSFVFELAGFDAPDNAGRG